LGCLPPSPPSFCAHFLCGGTDGFFFFLSSPLSSEVPGVKFFFLFGSKQFFLKKDFSSELNLFFPRSFLFLLQFTCLGTGPVNRCVFVFCFWFLMPGDAVIHYCYGFSRSIWWMKPCSLGRSRSAVDGSKTTPRTQETELGTPPFRLWSFWHDFPAPFPPPQLHTASCRIRVGTPFGPCGFVAPPFLFSPQSKNSTLLAPAILSPPHHQFLCEPGLLVQTNIFLRGSWTIIFPDRCFQVNA